jgi:carbamoyl-phosphate synthase large subunit
MIPVILISSIGRRSQLVNCARGAIRELNLNGLVLGADCSRTAPAGQLVDHFFLVPPCNDPEFLPCLINLCEKNHVKLLIPTIDTELALYAANRKKFAAVGTTVAISSPATVEICADKVATHQWLVENGFPTLHQGTPDEVLGCGTHWNYPLIVKPRRGSASIDVVRVNSEAMLHALRCERDDLIVQEFARGQEYTINVLADRLGRCQCSVPHLRLEVRTGEVSKGVTLKHTGLMELAREIVERLPGAYGALNVQGFLDSDGVIQVVEINARFGGGYPLAHHAGADFFKWMLEDLFQLPSSASYNEWENDLTMLRFDDAVFIPRASL